MAVNGYSAHKQDVLKRLARAEGQVRGVTKMAQSDTYCIDVITQISAAKAALDKVAVELIRNHTGHSLNAGNDREQFKYKADELAAAISRSV